jgi:hypothetical protein
MQDRFYVYEHLRKDSMHTFYVGKGTGHRARVANRHHRSEWWCRTAEKAGGFDVRFVVHSVDEELAFLVEVERIDQLRRLGVALCNIADGGGGTSGWVRTPEWREKIGRAHRGKTISAQTRQRLSDAIKAAGYRHPEDVRVRMSVARKGQQPFLGKKHSEETRRKMSAGRIGNQYSVGRQHSSETKAKMSAAHVGRLQTTIQCPHCGKTGGNAMRRWHFDACKGAMK